MKNLTGTGTTYRSRSANGALTRRRFAALGTVVLVAVGVLAIVTLIFPGWWAR